EQLVPAVVLGGGELRRQRGVGERRVAVATERAVDLQLLARLQTLACPGVIGSGARSSTIGCTYADIPREARRLWLSPRRLDPLVGVHPDARRIRRRGAADPRPDGDR